MKKKEIDLFEKVQTQLENIYDEISLLSKKSQNDVLNSFKLKLINKVIVDANSLLKASYKPFDEFDIFKEEELPTNSDVVFIISQYLGCFEKYKMDNVEYSNFESSWIWKSEDDNVYLTNRPKKL